MNADDVLEILRRLDDAGIEWWIHGGWGDDALLGRETRAHDDLDLAVKRADVERLRRRSRSSGASAMNGPRASYSSMRAGGR